MKSFPLFFLYLLLFIGCGGEESFHTPTETSGPTLTLRINENPVTLDPAKASRTLDGRLVCLIHAGLVRAATDGTPVPELAETWQADPDGRTFIFRLRKGLSFPSGRPATATDVVYSFSRVCRPETASPMAWVFEDFVGFDEVRQGKTGALAGVTGVDARTVRISLQAPSATLLSRLTMPVARIVDREDVEKKGSAYGRRPKALGAWELVQWVDDSHLEFRPNLSYPHRNRSLAFLRFQIVPRDFTASALFRSGRIDILDPLPDNQISRWRREKEWRSRIDSVPQYNVYYLGFGCHRPALNEPAVRKALARTVNVDAICKTLYGERAVRAYGPIPPGLPGYRESGTLQDSSTSPEDLRSLLKGLSLDLWFVDNDSTASLAMEAVQAELSRAGVPCRLRKTDPTTYMSWRREGRFDLFFANWWADYPDPDNFLYPLFFSGSGSNSTRVTDRFLDDLILKARQETDPSGRRVLYDQAVERLQELCPALFLWHRNHVALTQPWVTGYDPPRLFQGTLYLRLGTTR